MRRKTKKKIKRKNINDICVSCGLNRRFHSGKGGCANKLRKSKEIKVVRHLFVEKYKQINKNKTHFKKTLKKEKSNYKIMIHKKNFSDSLYKYFKLIKINPKHNFISFTTENKNDKIQFIFHSRINNDYNSNPLWKDIKCEEYILSDTMTIKTECDKIINDKYETKKDLSYPGFYKIFVKGYNNLYDYIQSIKKNKTTKKDHQLLFDKILKNLIMLKDKKLINHNLDVKTLHFKYF